MTRTLTALLLLALAVAGWQSYLAHDRARLLELAELTHKQDAADIDRLTRAAADSHDTITELRRRLDAAAGQLRDVQAAKERAEAKSAAAAHDRDAALAALTRARTELYAHDRDASSWAAGRVPAALSDELRRQWQDAAGGGAGHGNH